MVFIFLIIYNFVPDQIRFFKYYNYETIENDNKVDFKYKNNFISPEIIYYIHTRLDPRLSFEDNFKNNIELDKYTNNNLFKYENITYKPLAEVLDSLFLIQTSMPWLYGDYRYGYFLISIDNNILRLIDYHIPDSVFPTNVTKYKVEKIINT